MVHFTDRLRERRALVRRAFSREQARRSVDRVTDPCPSCGQPNHRVVAARIRQQAQPVMEIPRTSSGPSLAEFTIAVAIVVALIVALIQVPWDQVLR